MKKPPVGVKRNQASCKEHEQFVGEAVAALVQCGSAATVKEGDLECISPLGVVKGARKLRLILDLRQVNVCLKKYRFKLEDIRTAAKLFRKGDFVITFDLKSGYHHVDMAGNNGDIWVSHGKGSVSVSSRCLLACPQPLTCLTSWSRS